MRRLKYVIGAAVLIGVLGFAYPVDAQVVCCQDCWLWFGWPVCCPVVVCG